MRLVVLELTIRLICYHIYTWLPEKFLNQIKVCFQVSTSRTLKPCAAFLLNSSRKHVITASRSQVMQSTA